MLPNAEHTEQGNENVTKLQKSDGKYERTKLTTVRQHATRIRFDQDGPKRPITLPALPPLRTDLLEDAN